MPHPICPLLVRYANMQSEAWLLADRIRRLTANGIEFTDEPAKEDMYKVIVFAQDNEANPSALEAMERVTLFG